MSGFITHHGLRLEGPLQAAVWPGTPKAITQRLPWISAEVTLGREFRAREVFGIGESLTRHTPTLRQAAMRITYPVLYDGLEAVWAMCLGAQAKRLDDVLQPEEVDPGVYSHAWEWQEETTRTPARYDDGWHYGDAGLLYSQQYLRRATVVLATIEGVFELVSAYVVAWSAQGGRGEALLEVEYRGAILETDATTNTLAGLQALAMPLTDAVESHLVETRMGLYNSGVALDTDDAVTALSWQITCSRQGSERQSLSTGLLLEPPHAATAAEITATITLDHDTTLHALLSSQQAGASPYALQWIAVGETLAPGYSQRWECIIPYAILERPAPSLSQGIPQVTLSWIAELSPEIPAWLGSTSRHGRIRINGTNSTPTHGLYGGL